MAGVFKRRRRAAKSGRPADVEGRDAEETAEGVAGFGEGLAIGVGDLAASAMVEGAGDGLAVLRFAGLVAGRVVGAGDQGASLFGADAAAEAVVLVAGGIGGGDGRRGTPGDAGDAAVEVVLEGAEGAILIEVGENPAEGIEGGLPRRSRRENRSGSRGRGNRG